MNTHLINRYLDEIHDMYMSGDAREESYYSILERFILAAAEDMGAKKPRIVIMPKTKGTCNPDFLVKDEAGKEVGWIEAKRPGTDLENCEFDPQIEDYILKYDSLLVTDFLEFHFFRFHSCIAMYRLGTVGPGGIKRETGEDLEDFMHTLDEFISISGVRLKNPRELAEQLAGHARFIKDFVVIPELNGEPVDRRETGHIRGLYMAFEKYFIHGLSKEEFADIYSQTLTYSLFIASIQCKGRLIRREAINHIPQANGILYDMFRFISFSEIPPQLESCLDAIINLLNAFEWELFRTHSKLYDISDDPVVHFYETFLARYDSRKREKMGVYYTPASLVNYVVRSAHVLLKNKLSLPLGLAEEGVNVLDPAVGTAAFLKVTANVAAAQFEEAFGKGGGKEFTRSFLLNNLYGFEGMMAPYAIGHLKMLRIMRELDIEPGKNERLNIFLTNTLDMEEIEQSDLPGMSSLSRESRLAGTVKKETRVTVIVGNPPYSGHSSNLSEKWITSNAPGKRTGKKKIKTWIGEKIEAYKKIDGQRLDERNLKWLQDDYVKFIRFAQDKIEKNGKGVVGYITNHAYLDNPTFRGMRRSLMDTFDEIYVLDLHGNVSKKEKCPDGSKDENVFAIRQGVAITLMVKLDPAGNGKKKKVCRVFHADMWGRKEEKFTDLDLIDCTNIKWQEVFPLKDFYLFKPQPGTGDRPRKKAKAQYWDFRKVTDIFPVHSVGIVTARDGLAIKDSKEEILETVRKFAAMKPEKARRHFKLRDDTRDWKIKLAQKDLEESGMDEKKITRVLYRPFDVRYTYYTGHSRGFHCMPRADVMKHMLANNIGLVTVRQVAEGTFNHSLVTDAIIESRLTSSNKGMAYLFPLYLYPYAQPLYRTGTPGPAFNPLKQPNICPEVLAYAGTMQHPPKKGESDRAPRPVHLPPLAEQVFYYIYGILSCPAYRERFEHFLKIDFPRIPFTGNFLLFHQMAVLGEQLADLHLLKSKPGKKTGIKFEVEGDNMVIKGGFVPAAGKEKNEAITGRVYINSSQYFSHIPLSVWEFGMGGYRVMEKWLKDRRGYTLSHLDIRHYIKMAESILLTLHYQEKSRAVFEEIIKK